MTEQRERELLELIDELRAEIQYGQHVANQMYMDMLALQEQFNNQ